jgi:hypothetical protein
MSADTFCVDIAKLGELPDSLETLGSSLARIDPTESTRIAAGAVSPGFGGGISAFGAALQRFVASASAALTDDGARLRLAAQRYETCDLESAASADVIRRQLGASGSW